ncbi:flavin monoamine oxidase family protein [Streptomyces goshikiensis]|uniref:flavin monoamine oxidase family protein n=1 Tax=Streptomyces goshikiensis TaxID=1942 RepID=UPI00380DF099
MNRRATATSANTTAKGPGRRHVLKAAGATAVASALAAAGAGPARAEAAPWDVIVIGAGYAGGTAARELTARGLSTLVLEARDRIGGRVWTSEFAGERVELGGGWFGPGQQLVERELKRYSIGTTLDVSPTLAVMPGADGYVSRSPAEVFSRLGSLFDEFYAGSAQYFERPLEPLYRADLLRGVDHLSLADRIAQLDLSPVDHKWVAGSTAPFAGGNEVGALTGLAQWYQLAGGTYEGFHSTMSLKPDGGMTALLHAILADSKATLRLNSQVTSVSTTPGGWTNVRLGNGRTYRSRAVVVATPVNTWRTINFDPGLPKVHADAAREGVGVPHATKLWLHVRGSAEAVYAQSAEDGPLQLMLPQQELPDGRLYVAFSGPALNVSDRAAVQAAVRQFIPRATLAGYRATEWTKDRYALGGWGLRRPGQLLRQLPAIQQPHGNIVFAGSDIASGWYGAFVEGAIESGLKAAQQAASLTT